MSRNEEIIAEQERQREQARVRLYERQYDVDVARQRVADAERALRRALVELEDAENDWRLR